MTSWAPVVRLLAVAALVGLSGPIAAVPQRTPASDAPLPDYDVRAERRAASSASLTSQAVTGGAPSSRKTRWNPHTAAIRLIDEPGVSAPRAGNAASLRKIVAASETRLGLDPGDLESLDLVRDYTSASTGLRHVTYRQSFGGIPVFEGLVTMHIDGSGTVVRMTSHAARGANRPGDPALTASAAAVEAVHSIRPNEVFAPSAIEAPAGPARKSRFARGPFRRDVTAELTWFAVAGNLRLAWHVIVEPDAGDPQVYDVLIDAENGDLLLRRNRVRYSEGTGRVIQSNTTQLEDPRRPDPMPASSTSCPPPLNHQPRNLTAPFRDPATVLYSHGGLQGNNTLVLRGNVSTPAATGTFDGTQWVFDFPFNSAGAAETALFFALNFAHDFFYDLGFDEAAGNFQNDNFGRGGLGGDSIRGVARAAGRNNATFQPEPEGTSPIISMFLWDGTGCWAQDVNGDGTLDIDGDYDLDIVLHEFHHGVSHRLNTAFSGNEADAIGEGGSDFFAYSINGDTTLAEFSRPGGIRGVNSKGYGDWFCLLGFICEPHANGEIFVNVMWDVRERFRTDLVRGSEAAAINETHQLYVDALKLSPPLPTMLDMRDAMLQADALRNPGSGSSVNYCRIWESFAARGMGVNATDTIDNGFNEVGADFTVPAGCTAPPAPPTVTVTVATATATEAGPTNGIFTISRGEVRSTPTTVNYSLGGSAVRGTDYQTIPLSAVIPAGASSVDVVIVPIDDPQVENDETATLTLLANSGYVVGSPASGTVTIVSNDDAIDLVVTSLVAPAIAGAGDVIEVTDVTKNQGTASAPATVTTFYLSSNSSWSVNDTLLGSRQVPQLAVGETHSVSTTLTLPADAATEYQYIIAKADGPGAFGEVSESNNTRSDLIRIGPDLGVSALTIPATAGQGNTIAVTDTTRNSGGGTAGESTTRFYLSPNTSLSPDDTPLGARTVAQLNAGGTNQFTTNVTIPAVVAGSYYVIASADDGKVVTETSESNNTRYASIKIGADLQVSALSVPAIGVAGGTIDVTETTQNAGQGTAAASTTTYYLSLNTSHDPSDIKLSPSRQVGQLTAGVSSQGVTPVVLPMVAAGRWYVIALADDQSVVAETSETNNDRNDSILIGPDLDVTGVTAPTTATKGSTITVSVTIKNIGADTAPSSITRFYLSLNSSVGEGDILLSAEQPVPQLLSNATSTLGTPVTLPNNLTGKYYLIAVADGPGSVAESSETNNTGYRLVTINP